MSTSTKLTYLNGTKTAIKDAINNNFDLITNDTTFREYADKINELSNRYRGLYFKVDFSNRVCENCLPIPLKNDVVDGVLKQETTTGKNYLYFHALPFTYAGITCKVNDDGSINCKGTTTSDWFPIGVNGATIDTDLEKGTYTFSLETDQDITLTTRCRLTLEDGTYENINISTNNKTKTFTFSKKIIGYYVFIYSLAKETNYDFNIKLQFEKGSVATKFEKATLGASPNPEFPQPIDVFEGVENLFDKDNFKFEYGYYNDNGQIVQSTATSRTTMRIKVKANTDYSISGFRTKLFDDGAIFSMAQRLYYFDKNYTFISRSTSIDGQTSGKFTTPTNCEYIDIQIATNEAWGITFMDDVNTFMLNKGTTPQPYVPYKNDNYYNLFDKNNGTTQLKYFNENDGSLVTTTTQGNYAQETYIEVKPNTGYKLSGNGSYYRIIEYNQNKEFKIGYSSGVTNSKIITTSNDTKYIRISFKDEPLNVTLQETNNIQSYHTNYSIIKNSGKNLFNNRISNYTITSTGTYTNGFDRISMDFQEVNQNENYILSFKTNLIFVGIAFYDINKIYLSRISDNNKKVLNVTTPTNCKYIRAFFQLNNSEAANTSSLDKYEVILEKDLQTSYEPYREPTTTRIPLNNNFLAKIGNVKDEVDFVSGTLIKRIGKVVLDGSENWKANGTAYQFDALKSVKLDGTGISDKFLYSNIHANISGLLPDLYFGWNTVGTLTIRYLLQDTIDKFKQWLSTHNTEIYYELAQPQIIQLNQAQIKMFEDTNIIDLVSDVDVQQKLLFYKK